MFIKEQPMIIQPGKRLIVVMISIVLEQVVAVQAKYVFN